MLTLDLFLYLPPGPGGKAMSAGVICQVCNLLFRAWCTQGNLGTKSLGAIVCFGVHLSCLSIHVPGWVFGH